MALCTILQLHPPPLHRCYSTLLFSSAKNSFLFCYKTEVSYKSFQIKWQKPLSLHQSEYLTDKLHSKFGIRVTRVCDIHTLNIICAFTTNVLNMFVSYFISSCYLHFVFVVSVLIFLQGH